MGLFWRRPPKVEKHQRAANVEGLVEALRYEDPITDRDGELVDLGTGVREAAAAALAEMDGSAARDGLLRALEDPEESVRVATIRALREHGGSAGVAPLVKAVATWTEPERAEARDEALEALTALRHPGVPRHVAAQLMTRTEELDDADTTVLRQLAQAGGPAGVQAAIDDLVVHLREGSQPERAGELLVALAPDSVDPLIELLHHPRAQESAALALGAIHDSRAVNPLCSLLLDADDMQTRRAAAWALGEIKDLAALEPLLAATRDRDYGVRAAASAGFDKLGNAAIAVAMSALVRRALENGKGPAPRIETIDTAVLPALRDDAAEPLRTRVAAEFRSEFRRRLRRFLFE